MRYLYSNVFFRGKARTLCMGTPFFLFVVLWSNKIEVNNPSLIMSVRVIEANQWVTSLCELVCPVYINCIGS